MDTSAGNATASAEVFNPAPGSNGKWKVTGSMSLARVFHTATVLPNGDVLVAGGAPALNGNCVATAELLNPATGQWTATGNMTTPRCGHSATLLANGQVLVAGGDNDPGFNSLNSTELFNPSTGTWQATGSLNTARESQLAALLQNGKVLAAGGRDFVNGSFTDLAGAELFDPTQGTWSFTGSLSSPDGTPFGTPLANGDVFGGFAFYTPASGTWTNTEPTPPGFAAAAGPPTATLLTNGSVLMTGFTQVCRGCGPKPSNGALLFEFATNTKVTTGDMNVARVNDSAVRLPSGLVLVSGGVSQIFGQPIASAELYTP